MSRSWSARSSAVVLVVLLSAGSASAQFTGPSVAGKEATAAEARRSPAGSYVRLEGTIVAHLRDDYYRFRDDSGHIRVEIDREAWGGQPVGPADTVRILGELDRTHAAVPFVWVKTLEVVR
jgi:uncharacterized protein (TIGR00156 family)